MYIPNLVTVLENVEFLRDYEELDHGNGNNFLNMKKFSNVMQFKIICFYLAGLFVDFENCLVNKRFYFKKASFNLKKKLIFCVT